MAPKCGKGYAALHIRAPSVTGSMHSTGNSAVPYYLNVVRNGPIGVFSYLNHYKYSIGLGVNTSEGLIKHKYSQHTKPGYFALTNYRDDYRD